MDRVRPHPLIEELPPLVYIAATIGRHGPLRTAVDLLAAELDQPRPGGAAVVASTLDMLLIFILRTWYESNTTLETGAMGHRHRRSGRRRRVERHPRATRRTMDRCDTRRSIRPVARRLRPPIQRTGRPAATRVPVVVADDAGRARTADPRRTLSAIARRVGYASEFAFGKAFKRDYGVSPGSYRRRIIPD
jgi:AraC-like DNA-binding protein